MDTNRNRPLLAWQYDLYPRGHRDRLNLLLHILTAPLFMAGTALAVLSPALGLWALGAGLLTMVLVVSIQGRGHKREAEPPVPFAGPGDVVARLVAEQWITFPRWVLGGGFARAWRSAGR